MDELIDRDEVVVAVGVFVFCIVIVSVGEFVGVLEALIVNEDVPEDVPVFDEARVAEFVRLALTVIESELDEDKVFEPNEVCEYVVFAVCVDVFLELDDIYGVEVDVFDAKVVRVGVFVDCSVFVSGGE